MVSMETTQTTCFFDHDGDCQDHDMGPEIGHGLCAFAMTKLIDPDVLLAAFEASRDDSSRFEPVTIEMDDSDLQEAMEMVAALGAEEVAPVPYYEDEAHLIEVTRQSLRMCWDNYGAAEAERVSIAGHAWLLWLDRAETAERKLQSDEPLAAFSIDRMED